MHFLCRKFVYFKRKSFRAACFEQQVIFSVYIHIRGFVLKKKHGRNKHPNKQKFCSVRFLEKQIVYNSHKSMKVIEN